MVPAVIAAAGAGSIVALALIGDDFWTNEQMLFLRSSAVITTELSPVNKEENQEEEDDDTTDVINWSGTHQVTVANKNYWEPESIEEVEKIVKDCQERGQTIRPLGSSLSPNGVALNKDGMISMANLDKVLEIDIEKKTIKVEAGIPVREVRDCQKTWLCESENSPLFETIFFISTFNTHFKYVLYRCKNTIFSLFLFRLSKRCDPTI